MTVSMAMAAFLYVTSVIQLWLAPKPNAVISRIKTSATQKFSRGFGSSNRKPKQNQRIQFDLQSDFSPLFNWNTKQVFLYLTAEYANQDNSTSVVTFWDHIIASKDQAEIDLKKQRAKYSVWDCVDDSFDERNATLKLNWNIQPHVGLLSFGEVKGSREIRFAKPKE